MRQDLLLPRPGTWGRLAGVVITAALLSGIGLVAPGPARAENVASAQANVDALQQVVRETTAKLVEGTRRWEADRRHLAQLRLDVTNVQRRVDRAQETVDRQQAQVNAMLRQMYMQPASATAQVLLTQRPEHVLEALAATDAVSLVAGTQSEIIARAVTSRHRLQADRADAAALVDQAAALTRDSARRMAALQALAVSTADRLVAAQQALQQARAAEALRIRQAAERAAAMRAQQEQARIEAAAQAHQQAARDQALLDQALLQQHARDQQAREQRAHDAAATSRPVRHFPTATSSPAGGSASSLSDCRGGSTAGQANGNFDPGSLCPLWSAPGQVLRADAAAAFNRLSRYHAATVGGPLCVTDSYRSYSAQVAVYAQKPGLAAVPGTSEHGWGLAVDLCGGAESFGSASYDWLKANSTRFEFVHPGWAEAGGGRPEPWHWEFTG